MDWIIIRGPAWLTFLGFFAAAVSAGAAGSVFRPDTWYRGLSKPSWTPPDWIFPVVWPILYLLMSVAVWWASLSAAEWALAGVALWCWQIVVNALWSPVVFGARRLGAGLAVIVMLWIAVAATTTCFFLAAPISGWLMVPYLIWTTYAGALNFSLWRRNAASS